MGDVNHLKCETLSAVGRLTMLINEPTDLLRPAGDVILESPAHPVTEGDPLTLRCIHRHRPLSFRGDFYRDGSPLDQTSDGEMTIQSVTQLHEGLYRCLVSNGAQSPETWITVRGKTDFCSYT